jgi:hypothetical protein
MAFPDNSVSDFNPDILINFESMVSLLLITKVIQGSLYVTFVPNSVLFCEIFASILPISPSIDKSYLFESIFNSYFPLMSEGCIFSIMVLFP